MAVPALLWTHFLPEVILERQSVRQAGIEETRGIAQLVAIAACSRGVASPALLRPKQQLLA
jgi:hypothetical protein